MAETLQKRLREESQELQNDIQHENTKRQKSINQILAILEEEEEAESNQELSDIFQSLQQELSFDPTAADLVSNLQNGGSAGSENDEEEEEDDRVRMMRRLLEASDDELGIPNKVESADEESNGGEKVFSLGDGLWEFEDYVANYYDWLQSELFM